MATIPRASEPLVLYTFDGDVSAPKIIVAAKYCAVKLKVEVLVRGKDDCTPEFLAKSPSGKLPLLQVRDGCLSQSNAILRHIGRAGRPADIYARTVIEDSQIDSWLDWSMQDLDRPRSTLLYHALGAIVLPPVALQAALADMCSGLAKLDAHLLTHTYLVGERITLADIGLSCSLVSAFKLVVDEATRVKFPNAMRWFNTCVNQPQFVQSLGPVALCKAAAKPDTAAANLKALAVPKGSSGGGSAASTEPRLFSYKARQQCKAILATGKPGDDIKTAGWVKTVRMQENGALAFIELIDGSCHQTLQVVCKQGETRGFENLKENQQGSSYAILGALVESPAKGQRIEVVAVELQLLGPCDKKTYPLAKGGLAFETLRKLAHLRPRAPVIAATCRVRNKLSYAVHTFFQENGFNYIHTPLITTSDCEGAGEMFQVTTLFSDAAKKSKNETAPEAAHVPVNKDGTIDFSKDFFGKAANLTVSGQLAVENYACALTNVYTFGPTFRAEDSHTTRHLAEFWMIEPEICFANLEDDMDLAEAMIKHCCKTVLDECLADLEFLGSKLVQDKQNKEDSRSKELATKDDLITKMRKMVNVPLKRVTYTEAIEALQAAVAGGHKFIVDQKEVEPVWGMDLPSEMEKYLVTSCFPESPGAIVYNYPKKIKAFYMRENEDKETVAAMDILVPGIGELVGGSAREERLDVLERRIAEVNLEQAPYWWYKELRQYGSVPHAGFGLGFERLVSYCSGMHHIRDTIPFPRYPGSAEF